MIQTNFSGLSALFLYHLFPDSFWEKTVAAVSFSNDRDDFPKTSKCFFPIILMFFRKDRKENPVSFKILIISSLYIFCFQSYRMEQLSDFFKKLFSVPVFFYLWSRFILDIVLSKSSVFMYLFHRLQTGLRSPILLDRTLFQHTVCCK